MSPTSLPRRCQEPEPSMATERCLVGVQAVLCSGGVCSLYEGGGGRDRGNLHLWPFCQPVPTFPVHL